MDTRRNKIDYQTSNKREQFDDASSLLDVEVSNPVSIPGRSGSTSFYRRRGSSASSPGSSSPRNSSPRSSGSSSPAQSNPPSPGTKSGSSPVNSSLTKEWRPKTRVSVSADNTPPMPSGSPIQYPTKEPKSSTTLNIVKIMSGSGEKLPGLEMLTDDNNNNNVSSNDNPVFEGRFAEQYDSFLSYVKEVAGKLDGDFTTLGNVSPNPEYLFEETKKCREFAEEFLRGFWSIPGNLTFTKENQSKKTEKTSFENEIDSSAMCISFLDAIVDGKPKWPVSLSGKPSKELHVRLMRYVNKYNEDHPNSPEIILLGPEQRNFRKIVKYFAPNCSEASCTEFINCAYLRKVMVQEGKQVFVRGVVNCDFYPYKKGKLYGARPAQSEDRKIKPPITKRGCLEIEVNNKNYTIQVPLKPCCKGCQAAKNTFLKILKTGQHHQAECKSNKNVALLQGSPIGYSIKASSFFPVESTPKTTRSTSLPNSPRFGSRKYD